MLATPLPLLDAAPESATRFTSLFYDPSFHWLGIDWNRAEATFVHMTRETYACSPALDERCVRADDEELRVPLVRLFTLQQNAHAPHRPVRFLFHTGLAGATLLSRCLDGLGGCFSLREPRPLHQAAQLRLGASPRPLELRLWRDFLHLNLALLGRVFAPRDVALVKTTDVSTALMFDVGFEASERQALFLYQAPAAFVAHALKRPHASEWLQSRLNPQALRPVRSWLGHLDVEALPDGRAAALLWSMHVRTYLAAVEPAPCSIAALDVADLLRRPEAIVGKVARYFGFDAHARGVREAVGRTFGVHALDPSRPYDAQAYDQEIGELRARHADEIADGLAWARSIGVMPETPDCLPRRIIA
jgi:hypothetical protein